MTLDSKVDRMRREAELIPRLTDAFFSILREVVRNHIPGVDGDAAHNLFLELWAFSGRDETDAPYLEQYK